MPAKGPPRVNLAGGSLDIAHDDGEPLLASMALMYATGGLTDEGIAEETQERVIIPNQYEDAMKSRQRKQWLGAIDKEMKSLQEHEVYDLVLITSVPKEKKIVGSRFVFKQMADNRFKARLVVQGYVQEPGIDFGKSFAPVLRLGSQRVLLARACEHGWPIYQLDVQVAFLKSKIDSEVYVQLALGQATTDGKTGVPLVIGLKRSLYGLVQSPVLYYDTIDAALLGIGFMPPLSDPYVYTHGIDDTFAIPTLYVDDTKIFEANVEFVKSR